MDNQSGWLGSLKNLPSWLKSTFVFIGAIVAFIISFRENYHLYITVTIILLLLGSLLLSIYLAFAKKTPEKKGSKPSYLYPRFRPFLFVLMSIVFALTIFLIAYKPTQNFAVIALVGTPTTDPCTSN